MTVDTSSFLTKSGLLQTTGSATDNTMSQDAITTELGLKQDTLVSGTNIKSINNQSILGSGDIEIQPSVVNTLIGDETDKAPSVHAVNEALNDLTPSTIDLSKILWENPNPTQSFSPQNITLNSSDYDYLLVEFANDATAGTPFYDTTIVKKSKSINLTAGNMWSGSNITINNRKLIYTSNTQYNVLGGFNNGNSANNVCVPIRILGYKNTIPSVVQKESEIYSTTEQKVGTWIDGKPLYRKVVNITVPTVATESATSTSNIILASNIDFVRIISASMWSQDNTWVDIPTSNNINHIILSAKPSTNQLTCTNRGFTYYNERTITVVAEYTKTTD